MERGAVHLISVNRWKFSTISSVIYFAIFHLFVYHIHEYGKMLRISSFCLIFPFIAPLKGHLWKIRNQEKNFLIGCISDSARLFTTLSSEKNLLSERVDNSCVAKSNRKCTPAYQGMFILSRKQYVGRNSQCVPLSLKRTHCSDSRADSEVE